MQYPKPLMSIKELTALGLSATELKYACHIPGQTFARKTIGGGKWMVDTAAYEIFRTRKRS